MCFDNSNADWFAGFQEIKDGPATVEAICFECGAKIVPGEFRRHVFQQEHEECKRCEWEELAAEEEPCSEHDYGEQFDADICETCCKLLAAIKAEELAAGCKEWESQPPFGELWDAIGEDSHYGNGRYIRRAREMYPDDRKLERKLREAM